MMKKTLIISILLLTTSFVYAQRSITGGSRSSSSGEIFGIPIKPYAGVSVGINSFYGDVKPKSHNWLSGNVGAKLNLSAELGSEGIFSAHFNVMYQYLKQSQRFDFNKGVMVGVGNESNPGNIINIARTYEGNLNFRTHMWSIGIMGEYRHPFIFPRENNIRPFVGVGLSLLIFNPKSDRYFINAAGEPNSYENYYKDSYSAPYDHKYESAIRDSNLYGQGRFANTTLGIPIELGFEFRVIPNTLHIRLATSFTITLSDYIDGVGGKVARKARSTQQQMFDEYIADPSIGFNVPEKVERAARLQTNKSNDFYAFTYISFQFYLPFF